MPRPIINQTGPPPCIYRESLIQCSNERGLKDFRTCDDCPRWSLDLIYEAVYGRRVEQNYLWWRYEWIKYGLPYAKDRMLDYVEKPPQLRQITQSNVQNPKHIYCTKCYTRLPVLPMSLTVSLIVMTLIGIAILCQLAAILTSL